MATPTVGALTFTNLQGLTRKKRVYISDVANAAVTWDAGIGTPGSTSPVDLIPNEPLLLVGASLPSGNTVATTLQVIIGGQSTGDYIDIASNLNSLANRESLAIHFPAGVRCMLVQR